MSAIINGASGITFLSGSDTQTETINAPTTRIVALEAK